VESSSRATTRVAKLLLWRKEFQPNSHYSVKNCQPRRQFQFFFLPVLLTANWKMIICKSTCPSCVHTNTNKHITLQIFHHQHHFVLKLSLMSFSMLQHPHRWDNDHCWKRNLQPSAFVNSVFSQAFQMIALTDRYVLAILVYQLLTGLETQKKKNNKLEPQKTGKCRLGNMSVKEHPKQEVGKKIAPLFCFPQWSLFSALPFIGFQLC